VANIIKNDFNVKTTPALVIELKDGTKSIYDGKMKLPELVTWVLPHALSDDETIETDLKLDSEK
jgi:hypothetical protein